MRKNKEEYNRRCREKYHNNIENEMLKGARYRSKKDNIPFNLTIQDIIVPEYCPVLRYIKLETSKEGKHKYNSPSLDRIIPKLGYIKGNVRVISFRANNIKSDGNAEIHKLIIDHLRSKING